MKKRRCFSGILFFFLLLLTSACAGTELAENAYGLCLPRGVTAEVSMEHSDLPVAGEIFAQYTRKVLTVNVAAEGARLDLSGLIRTDEPLSLRILGEGSLADLRLPEGVRLTELAILCPAEGLTLSSLTHGERLELAKSVRKVTLAGAVLSAATLRTEEQLAALAEAASVSALTLPDVRTMDALPGVPGLEELVLLPETVYRADDLPSYATVARTNVRRLRTEYPLDAEALRGAAALEEIFAGAGIENIEALADLPALRRLTVPDQLSVKGLPDYSPNEEPELFARHTTPIDKAWLEFLMERGVTICFENRELPPKTDHSMGN